MNELNTEEQQNFPQRESVNNIPFESKVQLLFLGLLSISFVGYFALRTHWIGFIFGHLAALSIMGFYGCLVAAIAKKKGYRYGRAFQLGFLLPIILGVISAFLFAPSGETSLPLTCGGWVSLATGIIIVLFYSLVRNKDLNNQVSK
jgi:hypothetical protein